MSIQDRPVTVHDMEQFATAIQGTIREMGRQFVAALAEMRQSEGPFEEDSKDEGVTTNN